MEVLTTIVSQTSDPEKMIGPEVKYDLGFSNLPLFRILK